MRRQPKGCMRQMGTFQVRMKHLLMFLQSTTVSKLSGMFRGGKIEKGNKQYDLKWAVCGWVDSWYELMETLSTQQLLLFCVKTYLGVWEVLSLFFFVTERVNPQPNTKKKAENKNPTINPSPKKYCCSPQACGFL